MSLNLKTVFYLTDFLYSNVFLGPSCSKLTTLLVNVSLKFQTLISRICQYFLLKKCENFAVQKLFSFFQQKYQLFSNKVVKYLTSRPLNRLVKLTML